MGLMINGKEWNSNEDAFREMGTDNQEIANEIYGLAWLMHHEVDWSKPLPNEIAIGMTRESLDNEMGQHWQSCLSDARHFYREAAEWHEKRYDMYQKVKPLIELEKQKRHEVLTEYANLLHTTGMHALTRIKHIAQLQ